MTSYKLIFALFLFWGMSAMAHAGERYDEAPGELLYATHCKACHTEKIHWREQKLATNWASLMAQVRRWQANIGLKWSDEEITNVARYLNKEYYRFKETGQKKELSQGEYPVWYCVNSCCRFEPVRQLKSIRVKSGRGEI